MQNVGPNDPNSDRQKKVSSRPSLTPPPTNQPIQISHNAMAPTRTRTVKNKHAPSKTAGAPSSGGKRSASDGKRSASDGVSKPRGGKKPAKGPAQSQQLKEKNRAALVKKPKKRVYTAEELDIPNLNMITPVGVVKPPGKKKGKVFIDDRV